jgi:type I toxin-antitoxin system toxin SymE
MSSHLSNAVRYLSVLNRARRRRARKPIERVAARRNEAQRRPARAPQVLTLSSRRIPRQTMPEAVVPYLRMPGRWLEEHGFAIGADVQVLVEQRRVTLISRHAVEV